MTKGDKDIPAGTELRNRAEKRLSETPARNLPATAATEDLHRLVHELQVHQVELEMQNEELARARSEMESLLETYLDLYDFAPVGYLTLDAEGAIRKVNFAGAALLGAGRAELGGRRLALCLAPESRRAFADFLAESMSGHHGLECDVSLQWDGKEVSRVRLVGEAVEGGAECRVAMVDVTDRWRAEGELERNRSGPPPLEGEPTPAFLRAEEALRTEVALRRDVSARLDLLEHQLHEQEERVLDSDRGVDVVSLALSRDLRSPLRAIDAVVTQLSENPAAGMSPAEREMLRAFHQDASRVGAMFNGLLKLAKVSRSKLIRRRVSMKELAETAVAELVPPSERRRILVRVDDLPGADGDAGLLGVVWTSLLGNAVKFNRGRPLLHVHVGFVEEGGRTVYFVRDDGVGFDGRDADRAFGIFERLHDPKRFAGAGVGLALARRIIERHGGRIWAKGAVDEGATFFFTLEPDGAEPGRTGDGN